jgi:hypothetical protein
MQGGGVRLAITETRGGRQSAIMAGSLCRAQTFGEWRRSRSDSRHQHCIIHSGSGAPSAPRGRHSPCESDHGARAFGSSRPMGEALGALLGLLDGRGGRSGHQLPCHPPPLLRPEDRRADRPAGVIGHRPGAVTSRGDAFGIRALTSETAPSRRRMAIDRFK